MALEHNDRKFSSEWAIEELKVIYSNEPNKFYTFRLDRWVEKNHKINGFKLKLKFEFKLKLNYFITFHTIKVLFLLKKFISQLNVIFWINRMML